MAFVGILFAFAALAKPTVILATLALSGLALGLYAFIPFQEKWLDAGRIRDAVAIGAGATVAAIPYYIAAYRPVREYIVQNLVDTVHHHLYYLSSARDRLLGIFELSRREVVRGCAFHNAAVESAGSFTSTDEIVQAHKLEFTRRLIAVAQ